MDSKTIRTAILFSSAAVVLILLVVYAVNVGKGQRTDETAGGAATDVAEGSSVQMTEQTVGLHVIGDGFTAYGEQIGNQPRAFMYDESFFDPMRDVTQGINAGEEKKLTLQAALNGDQIHVSILNERGGLESGVAFQVSSSEAAAGREKTWTDTDRDGQIDITGLTGGTWRIRLLAVQGYEIPDTPVVVRVEGPGQVQGSAGSDAGTLSTAGTAAGEGNTKDKAEPSGLLSGNNLSGNDVPAWDSRPIIGSEGRKQ